MRIVVCIKQVVDTSVPLEVGPDGRGLVPAGLVFMPNPADIGAAALAAEWTAQSGGESVAVTLGPRRAEAVLRAALAQGIHRALLVPDDGTTERDAVAKATVLAHAIEPLAPDLVLCGARSADTGRGIVPGALAEFLGLPQVTRVAALRLADGGRSVVAWRRLERGRREEVACPLPALVAVEEGVAQVAYPALPQWVDALSRPIERVEAAPGPRGSNRATTELIALGPLRPRPKKLLAPESSLPAAERLQQLMGGGARKAQATDIVEGSAEELAAAFLRFLQQQGFLQS